MEDKIYSVVIPVFNSEKIVETTVTKTVEFFVNRNLQYEIILVNDGSEDNCWEIIKTFAQENEHIVAVNLLKNYGKHNAEFCGYSYATGDYIISMDDDMQNPPEEIIHLIQKAHEGYDAVFGQYQRKRHPLIRRIGSQLVAYWFKKIFHPPKGMAISNFTMLSKEVVDRIVRYRTTYPYIPGLILMFSSNPGNVVVEHRDRVEGKSHFTIGKIWQIISSLLFHYSSYPITFFFTIGFTVALISCIIGMIVVVHSVFREANLSGWIILRTCLENN